MILVWSSLYLALILILFLISSRKKKKKSPYLGPFCPIAQPSSLHYRKAAFCRLGVVEELGVPLGGLFVVQILLIPGTAGSL
jgi:hypothetical protein